MRIYFLLAFLLAVVSSSFRGLANTDAAQREPAGVVSYSRQIKPLLAIRCSGCHGPYAWWDRPYQQGFDVTTYESLMRGGRLGPDIVPGNPEQSRIVQYIRGTDPKRMPFAGAPLLPTEIELIARWIREGAKEDEAELRTIRVVLDNVRLVKAKKPGDFEFPYEDILCRIPVESYATITITDQRAGTVVAKRGGAIQNVRNGTERDLGSAAQAGGWLYWSLNRSNDNFAPDVSFPDVVSIELLIEDFETVPWGAEFGVQRRSNKTSSETSGLYTQSTFVPQPISLQSHQTGQFTYHLDGDADVDIGIVNLLDQRGPLVFQDHKADLQAGVKTYPWNLKDNNGNLVSPAGYVARFRSSTRNLNIPVNDICIVFQVLP